MYGFLQLIADGNPNKEKERTQAGPAKEQYVNNFWTRIMHTQGTYHLSSFYLSVVLC
jgi:hypothetical protein